MKFRAVVETTDGNKYYPGFVSLSSTDKFPWAAPVAAITINTNITTGTSGYMSPIRNDDIIRFQVSTSSGKVVYQDLFEGRIMSIGANFGYNNNHTTLQCRGHSEELLYRVITADYSASSDTTGTMLASLVSSYLTRLTGAALIDTAGSTSITNYNVKQDTKYMADVVKEFEALESYGYVLKAVPVYDSVGSLSSVDVSWQAVPSTMSTSVQIIEGTPRLISANFNDSIEQVVEDVTVYGESGTPQKVGTSINGSPAYNTRYHIETDTTLATDNLCGDLADAIRGRFGDSIVRGQVRILGTPGLNVGDLVYVKIPSIEINGATIDGNYRIRRLTNNIDSNGWFIDLDLGEIIDNPSDMFAGFHADNRIAMANFID